jgi:phosphatidylserine/phosphatidylglycerophosphate/cardiolipin synthase-like enzyme
VINRLVAVVLAFLLLPSRLSAEQTVQIVNIGDLIRSVGEAHTITISAYTMSPRSRIGRALIAAAARGAAVSIVLDGNGLASANRSNANSAKMYRGYGARVRLTSYKLHMKAAIFDGNTIFVSDRNWSNSGHSLILQLPSIARIQVERAILGEPSTSANFATRKADALALETALLSRQHSPTVLVSTESFSRSPVSDAIDRRARDGDDVTLVVARYEYEHNQVSNFS